MEIFVLLYIASIAAFLFYIKKIKRDNNLSYLKYHDKLTGLPNKDSLKEFMKELLSEDADATVALLYIDMDNFKYINEVLGHDSGDHLLWMVGKRLELLMKEGCNLYKLSGDEYIIVIQNVRGSDEAEVFASYICAAFKERFEMKGLELYINLSIGIVVGTGRSLEFEDLFKHAEIALYKAKDSGKNKCVIYDKAMNKNLTERMFIERHMHMALSKDEFEIYYQPQLSLSKNKITGFEALLRWNSPELGLVSPEKFIKVAEESHIIIPVGTWVLRKSCEFLKNLREKGYEDLTLSINLSILQLLQPDFGDIVLDALEFYHLSPDSIELEITETILMESFEIITEKLKALKGLGVRVALDDFGKGYSSLNYLKKLPISTIKIDKTFIDSIVEGEEDKSLVGQIIDIGRILGMSVVAEGVEKQAQAEYLIKKKCDKMQGYFFSKPLPEKEAVKLIEKEASLF